jgi:hypothetical protein
MSSRKLTRSIVVGAAAINEGTARAGLTPDGYLLAATDGEEMA